MRFHSAFVAVAAVIFVCLYGQKAVAPRTEMFRDAARSAGLVFDHFNGATGEYYLPEIMGAGVALIDYDQDGDLDVYVIHGDVLNPNSGRRALFPLPAGQSLGHKLFRNMLKEDGRLHFVDVTPTAGVGYRGYGMGVATGDYDNDGYPDLYVTNFGHNVLYHNNGNGTFTDVTREAGVDDDRWSTGAAFFDYDRDGDLDLFVANYLNFTVKGNKTCYDPTGTRDYCTPSIEEPAPSRLFRNEGGGRFIDVTKAARIDTAYGPGLGVACADFNADGWPDIYVANDGAANLLWINRRDGTFEERGLMSGAAYSVNGVARAGMGVAVGDFDTDGDDDILVTNLRREGSTLYRNDGHGDFSDATAEAGLTHTTFPYTGFGAGWLDYDNDGRLDLFIANGAVTILESLRGSKFPYHQPNLLFHNQGPGKQFRDITAAAGGAMQLSEVSRGAAFGDIDNDGDIDIVVSNNNGPLRLLLNESRPGNSWLQVRVQGVRTNRDGLGARVGVQLGEQPVLWRRVHTDGSYLSASDIRVHFGLGKAASIREVVVEWPDGNRESWKDVRVNSTVRLREGTGQNRSLPR